MPRKRQFCYLYLFVRGQYVVSWLLRFLTLTSFRLCASRQREELRHRHRRLWGHMGEKGRASYCHEAGRVAIGLPNRNRVPQKTINKNIRKSYLRSLYFFIDFHWFLIIFEGFWSPEGSWGGPGRAEPPGERMKFSTRGKPACRRGMKHVTAKLAKKGTEICFLVGMLFCSKLHLDPAKRGLESAQ